jgi:general secretion pathway protein L
MPDRLLLRLSPTGDLTWLRQAGDGRAPTASTRGGPSAAALADAREIVVLVPAEAVLLTESRVAAKSRAQLLQAVPFAIEDQLLAPVEDLQFAVSASEGDAVGVAIVARTTLRQWLARLADAGIRPDVVMPESLAIPLAPGHATALVENDRAIVRLAPWSAFACAPNELRAWLAQDPAPKPVDLLDFRDAASKLDVEVAREERLRDPLAFLARNFTKAPVNLLAGEFASQHRGERGARWWRFAAALAAAVLVLAVLDLGIEVLQLSRTSARMETLSEEAVRKAFPDVEARDFSRMTAADIARTRIERLRGGAESSDFLRLLASIAPVIGGSTRIQTRGIEFRNGSLELGLRAPDVATLDTVREKLAAQPGLNVAVTAANPGDGGIDGRIRVGSAGAAK